MTAQTATPEVAASAVVAAMEHAWAAIRARHPQVPEVIVILGAGSEARRGLFKLGHFAAARWQVAGQRRAEVLVSGEGLQRGARDVLGTLLHEAAHGLADTRGIQDTSRRAATTTSSTLASPARSASTSRATRRPAGRRPPLATSSLRSTPTRSPTWPPG
jgi:hypothetical protein